MITLKQFKNLIPYYQEYDVWYAKSRCDDYIYILGIHLILIQIILIL